MLGATEKNLYLTCVIYLLAYAVDPLIWVMAFKKFLKPKFNKRIYYILCFSVVYILIIVKQALVFFSEHNIGVYVFPIMIMYIFTISRYFFEGKTSKKISLFIGVYFLSVVTDGIFSFVFMFCNVNSDEIVQFCFTSSVATLVVRLTSLILYFSLKNFYEIIKEKSSKLYMMVIYVVVFAGSYIFLAICSKEFSKHVTILYCLYGLQVTVVLILASYAIILIKEKTIKEKEALESAKMSESKLALFQYTKETYEELKSMKHDLKRHYNYIFELNRLGESQAIAEYLTDLCSQLKDADDLYVCDNLVLGVAINDKRQLAKKMHIAFSTIITVNTFPFTDSELNSVVTNVLDNAFEAVVKVTDEEKIVKLTIKKINDQEILIYCVNTYNKNAYFDVPFLSTIKPDRENHGYGIKIVKTIVNKYKGTAVYWKDKNNFYVKIIVRGKAEYEDFNM